MQKCCQVLIMSVWFHDFAVFAHIIETSGENVEKVQSFTIVPNFNTIERVLIKSCLYIEIGVPLENMTYQENRKNQKKILTKISKHISNFKMNVLETFFHWVLLSKYIWICKK